MVVASSRTSGELVLALTLVTASHADALQLAHRARIFGRKLLRVHAKRTQQLWQLIGGVRAFRGDERQFRRA